MDLISTFHTHPKRFFFNANQVETRLDWLNRKFVGKDVFSDYPYRFWLSAAAPGLKTFCLQRALLPAIPIPSSSPSNGSSN